MAQAVEFELPYHFAKEDVTVVIRHSQEKNLRAKPGHKDKVDANGGFGDFARFKTKVRVNDGITEAQFVNVKTGECLRIKKMVDEVDVAGKGGPLCWFRVHFQNIACVKLESVAREGLYIAVDKDGVRVGKGGPWCRLNILREGVKREFSIPYRFVQNKVVVIEHRDRKYIRVTNAGSIDTQGGVGELARWSAEPSENGTRVRLKNVKSGKYLRIGPGGKVNADGGHGPFSLFRVHPVEAPHQVRLESNKREGEFIALDGKNNTLEVGAGKHKRCFFTFYRND